MALERKTVIDQIEIARDGSIQIRLALLLVDDGVEDPDPKWHRTIVEPGGDVDAQIAAVNAHLQAMGKPSVETDRIAQLKSVVALVHTKTVVDDFRTKRAAQDAEAARLASLTP